MQKRQTVIVICFLVVLVILNIINIFSYISFKRFEKEYWTQHASYIKNYTKTNKVIILGLAAIGQKVKVTKSKMDILVPSK